MLVTTKQFEETLERVQSLAAARTKIIEETIAAVERASKDGDTATEQMLNRHLAILDEHQSTIGALLDRIETLEKATLAMGQQLEGITDILARWVRESATIRDIEERHHRKVTRDRIKIEKMAESVREDLPDAPIAKDGPDLPVADDAKLVPILTDGSEGPE